MSFLTPISYALFFFIKVILFFLFTNVVNVYGQSSNTTLEFSNVRNSKGFLQIALYKTEEYFLKEKPFSKMKIAKSAIVNGKVTTSVSLPIGTYGIGVLDDENDNRKMDYNFVGMPKEGFGFSNYYHGGFTRPKLSQFVVTVGGSSNFFKFALRYM